jgi:large subunit ribosomal protein L31
MKADIHPAWFPESKVVCACGNTWITGATQAEIRTDICSACHPFYTGEQRIVDTEGQVDRFMKRLQMRDAKVQEVEERAAARTPLTLPLVEVSPANKRYAALLAENGIATAGDFIAALERGEEEKLLEIPGIGRKALADFKKALRTRGYELPAATSAE